MPFKDYWIKHKWLIIGAVIALLFTATLLYYFLKPSGYICPPGQIKDTICGTGGCVPVCSDTQTYDCSSRSCVCNPGTVQCGDRCCLSENCQTASDTSKHCCPPSNWCGSQCCGAGESCINPDTTDAHCGVVCGPPGCLNGADNECPSGYKCVTVSDIPSQSWPQFQNKANTCLVTGDTSGTASICYNDNAQCQAATNPGFAPAPIHNFYPCINGVATDPDDGGVGFCYNPTKGQSSCWGQDKSNCASPCQWVNIAKDITSTDGTVTDLNAKLANMPSGGIGNWCLNGPSARVNAISMVGTCTWQDCWAKIAQPGVVDVYYDEAHGTCIAIQDCDENNLGLTTDNKDVTSLVLAKAKQNKYNLFIPQCSTSSPNCDPADIWGYCPNSICQDGNLQCQTDGGIQNTKGTWACKTPTSIDASLCGQVPSGTGDFESEQECLNSGTCSCPPGYIGGWKLSAEQRQQGPVGGCYRIAPYTVPGTVCHWHENLGDTSCQYNTDWGLKQAMAVSDTGGYNAGIAGCSSSSGCSSCIADTRPTVPYKAFYCSAAGTRGAEDCNVGTAPYTWKQCTTEGGCPSPWYNGPTILTHNDHNIGAGTTTADYCYTNPWPS